MMPQKKNPQIAEHVRGRVGRRDRPADGAARRHQGPAAGVQLRPAGGQGARVRAGRRRARLARGARPGVRRHPLRRRADGGRGRRRPDRRHRRGRGAGARRHAVPRRRTSRSPRASPPASASPTRRPRRRSRRATRPACRAATPTSSTALEELIAGLARPRRPVSSALLPDARDGASARPRCVMGGVGAPTSWRTRFGTPLYVYDAATLRARAAAYAEPLAAGGGRAMFALKANGTPGVLRLLREAGLGADVGVRRRDRAGAGGRVLRRRPGRARQRQGRGRPRRPRSTPGRRWWCSTRRRRPRRWPRWRATRGVVQDVLVRVTPDIAVDTHRKIQTGARRLEVRARSRGAPARSPPSCRRTSRGRGLHVHLGSQVVDAGPLALGRRLVRAVLRRQRHRRPTCSTSAAGSASPTRRASRRPTRAPTRRRWPRPCRPRSPPSGCRRRGCCSSRAARSSPRPA